MKKFLVFALFVGLMVACGSDSNSNKGNTNNTPKQPAAKKEVVSDKGIGEITNVTLNDPLNPEMVAKGKAIYEMKCAACHKLTGARVVGPSWEGITKRRKPEWIMNMITNVDVMLEKDPAAQKLLEECLTRMPNQNVSIGDARDVVEFMYSLDQGS